MLAAILTIPAGNQNAVLMNTFIQKISQYPTRIPQIYGTLVAVALIVYFFLVYALGFIHVTELRVVNLFIQVAGIVFALKQYRRTHDGTLNYMRAMFVGVATSFIATSTFVLFLFVYLQADTPLMEAIRAHAPLGEYLNPYIATFSVWLEGMFSGVTATFIIVNYIHTDWA